MKSFPSAITWHLAERDTLPDADTDVLVYVEDEPEAQLGALTGENADGSLAWVGAQGERVVADRELVLALLAGRVARGGEAGSQGGEEARERAACFEGRCFDFFFPVVK